MILVLFCGKFMPNSASQTSMSITSTNYIYKRLFFFHMIVLCVHSDCVKKICSNDTQLINVIGGICLPFLPVLRVQLSYSALTKIFCIKKATMRCFILE